MDAVWNAGFSPGMTACGKRSVEDEGHVFVRRGHMPSRFIKEADIAIAIARTPLGPYPT